MKKALPPLYPSTTPAELVATLRNYLEFADEMLLNGTPTAIDTARNCIADTHKLLNDFLN